MDPTHKQKITAMLRTGGRGNISLGTDMEPDNLGLVSPHDGRLADMRESPH